MLSLETIGCYSTTPGSQAYPFPLGSVYRSTGDFIAFVTNRRSRHFLQRFTAAFEQQTTLPFIAAALPTFIPGVAWSDHWAFWQEGFPGVMITDTAPFRYPHYHASTDTPDKIDYETLAHLVCALTQTVAGLATPVSRESPAPER
jgi:Zn-dependent M28 family amino/carboxypeptidase